MNTIDTTYIRNSSIYITDAISCESFVNEPRFHNNLYLASNYAQANGLNVQNNADKVGLMPYQYEYDKGLKCYSITVDLENLIQKKNQGFYAGLLKGQALLNEDEIEEKLQTIGVSEFFSKLGEDVKTYFDVMK